MRHFILIAVFACSLWSSPAWAQESKPCVSLVESPSEPYAQELKRSLAGMKRFHYLPLAQNGWEALPTLLARAKSAREAAGCGASSAYVFVPRHTFGPLTMSTPRSETRLQNGQVLTTLSADLSALFRLELDVYEVDSGKLLTTLRYEESLSRRFEAHYDQNTSDYAVETKRQMLISALNVERFRGTESAFGAQARDRAQGIASRLALDLKNIEAFKLKPHLSLTTAGGASTLDVGTEQDVALDDAFKVFRGSQEIGLLKVRKLGPNQSSAEAIFQSGAWMPGDRLEEYPKRNQWQGLKLGAGWLGGPALVGTYSIQQDTAAFFGVSELYGALDASMMINGAFSAYQGEVGLLKRSFNGRWGSSYGLKGGAAALRGVTGDAFSFGLTPSLGLDVYLWNDLLWNVEAGFQLYSPVRQKGGSNDGAYVQPFGPLIRTGLSYVF